MTAPAVDLDRVDYDEAFTFDTTVARSPESWARLILEGAPLSKRLQMIGVWTALGIRLARPGSPAAVLGWPILRNDPDAIVLGVRAAAGLAARLTIQVEEGRVTQSMVVRYENRLGRGVWTRLAPGHHRFVESLVAHASTIR